MATTARTQTPQLELGHVLFTEIMDYFSLPKSQQQTLLEQLQEGIRSTSEFNQALAQEQIISLITADGMALVFFGDPQAPLRCALEICRTIRGVAGLRLRMGLHSGPVYPVAHFNYNRSISGGGISVAQKVVGCGDDGHILVSKSTAELLRPLGPWNGFLHDLGEVDVMHSGKLHLFNFWNGEVGNSKPPKLVYNPTKYDDASQREGRLLGQLVSHYRVLHKLGSGGMGVVYEAEDTRLGRHVALKLLSERFSRSNSAIQRFQREASTASSLNHPNICTVHDVGEHEGRRFIVMELLQGKNLKQVIMSGPLTQERIVTLGVQIAEGLEAAHTRGIIHRDIKPANLFVIPRERVKILDFGLAKLTARERSGQGELEIAAADEPTRQEITVSGEFVGTVSYMSPEQARGELLDHRTDLFSFGVVLYEMATGVLPFRGDTSAVVFDAILNRTAMPVRRVNPQLSPELERIVARALEKSPDLRYQSAADIGAELRGLGMRTSVAVAEPPPAVPEPETKAGDLDIVLLYKRSAQPDEEIMQALLQKLTSRGYRVFVDRHLVVGVEWAHEIERKIGSADAVIPLLSASSVTSEMLSYELELARSFAGRQNGKPRLLPIRVQFQGDLPDSLHSILDGLNYSLWKNSGDDERIIEDVVKALSTPQETFRRKPNLEPVGGALSLDSKFYIERPTDEEFYSAVARNDSIVLLKGARQMGKTSLMARGLQQARKAGARVVLTDFQKLNAVHLQSVESLFHCLAEAIAEQLDMEVAPEVWNPRRGASMNFERFLRREILTKINGRLVWGIDEVDRLFACTFGSEVFGLFRSWHNERSLDPSGPWQNLALAIAYASEAHLFITDVNQSPFNVGTRLVLADFTLDQVQELNNRYGCPLRNVSELERFFSLLGGQPFLTQRGLHHMTEKSLSFYDFSAGAARDDGPYGDHLRRIFVSLSQDPALCDVVRDVISGRHSSSADSFYRLRSSGIVAGESARDMKLRCQLYEQYLSRHLI